MNIAEYLASSAELSALCRQNGWIDNSSLDFKIVDTTPDSATVAVNFKEILMEGSGCIADKKSCFGYLKLKLSQTGDVVGCEVL